MHVFRTRQQPPHAANALLFVCQLLAVLTLAGCILAVLGRISVNFITPEGRFENVLLIEAGQLEPGYFVNSRFLFTSLTSENPSLYLNGSLGFLTHICLAFMVIIKMLPIGICCLLMARLFQNILAQQVFTASNARTLRHCGNILIAAYFLSPIFIGSLLPFIINQFTPHTLYVSAHFELSLLIVGIVFSVMSYIFSYGLYLQEEVDQTI